MLCYVCVRVVVCVQKHLVGGRRLVCSRVAIIPFVLVKRNCGAKQKLLAKNIARKMKMKNNKEMSDADNIAQQHKRHTATVQTSNSPFDLQLEEASRAWHLHGLIDSTITATTRAKRPGSSKPGKQAITSKQINKQTNKTTNRIQTNLQ
jgi:hypothetical protein